MKILLTFATMLFAVAAQATPAVGDSSKFALTLSQGTQQMTGTYEISLTAATATGYTMATVVTFTGQQPQRSESAVTNDDLLDDATIAAVLGNCAQEGGQSQQVTVPAGTYASCAVPTDSGTVWIAAVPFGIVKQTQKQDDGSDLVLDLISSVPGK